MCSSPDPSCLNYCCHLRCSNVIYQLEEDVESARCVVSRVTAVLICCLELLNNFIMSKSCLSHIVSHSVETGGWAVSHRLKKRCDNDSDKVQTAHEQFNKLQ